jgi:hypothetical protein
MWGSKRRDPTLLADATWRRGGGLDRTTTMTRAPIVICE